MWGRKFILTLSYASYRTVLYTLKLRLASYDLLLEHACYLTIFPEQFTQ
jgi:hypothetical protein